MANEKIWEKYRDRQRDRNTGGGRMSAGYAAGHGQRGRGGHPPVRERTGTAETLRSTLRSIDHRGYPAYKELTGRYDFGRFSLWIDHVQGDPFAAPSSVSIHIDGKQAGFPEEYYKTQYENRRALQDHLIRLFHNEIDQYSHRAGGSGKSGLMSCSHPGQEILDRSACQIDPESGDLIFRLSVGFPAAGRTILAGELEKILFDYLPACVNKTLFYGSADQEKLAGVIALAEDQTFLREEMKKRGLIAFVADGAVLPRESGISQKPMRNAVPFRSPEEDRIEVNLPHRGKIAGMGIPRGITLIIGGGYHGKSTLLQALERGVYDHVAGDGREFVLTDETAMKIRAEDGRCVMKDDISPFIRNLPDGRSTAEFSTEDASGSTSQASSVTEAAESGARVLLMDEDTCATNFMVRDELMQRIVSPDEEPIIPYSRIMKPMYTERGISTVLVAGSSGAFFPVADRIIQMNRYEAFDVTKKVREVLESLPEEEKDSGKEEVGGFADESSGQDARQKKPGSSSLLNWDFSGRCPRAGREFSGRDGRVKHKNLGRDGFMIGHGTVDLRCVEQIVDPEQTECLAQLMLLAAEDMDGHRSVQKLVELRMKAVREKGLAGAVSGRLPGNLALPRAQELFAAIDRCRMLKMQ